MLPVEHVADHVLALSPYGLSNRELQKILYFAQGFYLAETGEPLFRGTLYAWEFGPVNLTIWHKFKAYGYNTIVRPAADQLPPIDANIAAFLAAVMLAFGNIPQNKLIEYTHADTPWAASYIPQANKILDPDEIKNYFSSFASQEEYLEHAQQKLAFHELVAQRKTYLANLPNLGNDWISGRAESPSADVCNAAVRFLSGLERYLFASQSKPDIPKLVLGPIPTGGVGLEFKGEQVALYVHIHNGGMVEIDTEREGNFDSTEISFPEFEEDFATYYRVLNA